LEVPKSKLLIVTMPNTMPRTEPHSTWRRRGVVSRADLLEALQREELDWFALPSEDSETYGFQRQITRPEPVLVPVSGRSEERRNSRPCSKTLQMPECWAVSKVQRDDDRDSESEEDEMASSALVKPERRASREESDEEALYWLEYGVRRAWPRRYPELRRLLGSIPARRRAPVDWAAVTRRIARGRPLAPLPRRQRPRWPANLVLALDRDSPSMTPLISEMDGLEKHLQRVIGRRAVDIRIIQSGHVNSFGLWRHPDAFHADQTWRPLFGEPIVLVSDLGTAPRDEYRRAGFKSWMRRMAHGGTEILLLAHTQPPTGLLPPGARQMNWFPGPRREFQAGQESPELADLLALVAMIGGVSDVLLRALAEIVNPGPPPLDLIWAAWNHPEMRIAGRDCFLTENAVEHYRPRLGHMALERLRRAAEKRRLLQAPRGIADEHLAVLRMHCLAPAARDLPGSERAEAAALSWLGNQMPSELKSSAPAHRAFSESLAARVIDLAHPKVIQAHRVPFRRLQRLVAEQALRRGESVPTHPELGPVSPDAEDEGRSSRSWVLARRINQLWLLPAESAVQSIALADGLNFPVGASVVVDQGGKTRWVEIPEGGRHLVNLSHQKAPINVKIGRTAVRLDVHQRPSWASGWAHTDAGMRVQIPTPWEEEIELSWPGSPDFRVAREHRKLKFEFGVDEFGLFMDMTVKRFLRKAIQRFRWIEPGEYLMGSPEDEPERDGDEGPRHLVRLSEGFWLADCACTQAFWLAVLDDKNPSKFNDDPQCPVEQISWNDVDNFLRGLRELFPQGAKPGLPTEAQWEYACRAGTVTPFSFGESITPEQVNYDGNYPYHGGKKGEYRQRTVPVKSLPPNRWGLYEMHGNVLEWCADGLREYEEVPEGDAIVDPEGPLGSASRVLRGGSWIRGGRHARSTIRDASRRDDRYHDVGFRMVLRSTGTSPGGPEYHK